MTENSPCNHGWLRRRHQLLWFSVERPESRDNSQWSYLSYAVCRRCKKLFELEPPSGG